MIPPGLRDDFWGLVIFQYAKKSQLKASKSSGLNPSAWAELKSSGRFAADAEGCHLV